MRNSSLSSKRRDRHGKLDAQRRDQGGTRPVGVGAQSDGQPMRDHDVRAVVADYVEHLRFTIEYVSRLQEAAETAYSRTLC